MKKLAVLLLASQALATTINVPADQPTVADGLAAASYGDTVLITGTFNESGLSLKDGVTLRGATGSGTDIIDANGAARVFSSGLPSTMGDSTRVENLGLTDGAAVVGAAFNITNSTTQFRRIIINDCDIYDHATTAVYIGNGAATIKRTTIRDTTTPTTNPGGGIYMLGGLLVSSNNRIENNRAGTSAGADGGGVYISSGVWISEADTIIGNSAQDVGGGVYASGATGFIKDLVVRADTSGIDGNGVGGGMYLVNTSFVFEGLKVDACVAQGNSGGGIETDADACNFFYGATVDSCTSGAEGASYSTDGSISSDEFYNSSFTNPLGTGVANAYIAATKFYDCTISGSPSGGDVVYMFSGAPVIDGCVITGGDDDGIDGVNASFTIRNNLVKRNGGMGIETPTSNGFIIGNTVVHNGSHGIGDIIGENELVLNNVVANNGGFGLEGGGNMTNTGLAIANLLFNNTSGARDDVPNLFWFDSTSDPVFVHTAADSFRVNQSTSPAIDLGWNEVGLIAQAYELLGTGWDYADSVRVVYSSAAGDSTDRDTGRMDAGWHGRANNVAAVGGKVGAR